MNSASVNPRDHSSIAGSPCAARGAVRDEPGESPVRVLIVDDNAISQLVTLQQLRQLGCVPVTVSSGAAAIEAIVNEQFDLIFLDCRMPELDGYNTARTIRKLENSRDRRRTAIVAITGDDDIECVDKCLSAGMDGHLAKPTSIEELRRMLERFLG